MTNGPGSVQRNSRENHTPAPKYDIPRVRVDTPRKIEDSRSNRKIDRLLKDSHEKDTALKDAEDTIKQLTQVMKQNNYQHGVAAPLTTSTINATGIIQPTLANRDYCLFFSSAKGCTNKRCKRIHAIPSKNRRIGQ